MLSLLLIAAAGTYTAPRPLVRDSWISAAYDFPRRGVPHEELSYIAADLTVDTHGNVTDCTARALLGNPKMAPYTCKLLRARAEFKPARDPSGRRMYGLIRQKVGWWWSEKMQPPQVDWPADFQVAVGRLPPDVEQPPITEIQFLVDVNGIGSFCTPAADTSNQQLAQIACERLSRVLRVTPARDRKGQSVPSVQTASVKFVEADAAK